MLTFLQEKSIREQVGLEKASEKLRHIGLLGKSILYFDINME